MMLCHGEVVVGHLVERQEVVAAGGRIGSLLLVEASAADHLSLALLDASLSLGHEVASTFLDDVSNPQGWKSFGGFDFLCQDF